MTNKTDIAIRRVIYVSFILLFLILAPSVVLYTQGFRYSARYNKLEKTGILVVSTAPKKTTIYFNDSAVAVAETPARISGLAAGDYNIKLTADGYHDWQKKLTVRDGITTFAENVILWKKSMPTMIGEIKIKSWLESPDRKKIAFFGETSGLFILNLENGELSAPFKVENGESIVDWSVTGKKIIVARKTNQKTQYLIINVDGPTFKLFDLAETKIPADIIKIEWDLESDNLIYSLTSEGLWQTDVFRRRTESILTEAQIEDFIVSDEAVYFIKDQTLYQKELNSDEPAHKIKTLVTGRYAFVDKQFSALILSDTVNQKVILIDKKQIQPDREISATRLDWLNAETFLFYNDWEIWIYDQNEEKPDLITRSGQPIVAAVWHPLGRHIIFAGDNKIKIIELDNRDVRNIVSLTGFDRLENCVSDMSGDNLYFNGQIGKQIGVFRLILRETKIIGLIPKGRL